jgi:tRNA(adenine34) deaminase
VGQLTVGSNPTPSAMTHDSDGLGLVGRAAADDAEAMELALAEAAAALRHGDVPVGAVVVRDGLVVAARHNERERLQDPTAHAELLALRDAAGALGRWRLDDCTLVVTLEPCVMCAGALLNARIGRLVYGAADLKAGATASLYNVCADPRLNHNPPVTHGVLAERAAALLTGFFGARRAAEVPTDVDDEVTSPTQA